MKTVNSLSGGKSSSYIAANYPADYNVFSLVRTNDKNCIYPDAKIRKIVSDKIGTDFIGTLEQDNIIKIMLDLEQFIGKEITWITAETFDSLINDKLKTVLPNQMHRQCTHYLKFIPILNWWNKVIGETCDMRIGFRKGEEKRKEKIGERLINGYQWDKVIVGKSKNGNRNKWENKRWRKLNYPLIDNNIKSIDIDNFWNKNKTVRFEKGYYNNCVGCFHRNPMFLNKMAQEHPNKMEWFSEQEHKSKYWKSAKESYKKIINYNSQHELSFDDFNECDSGFCGL